MSTSESLPPPCRRVRGRAPTPVATAAAAAQATTRFRKEKNAMIGGWALGIRFGRVSGASLAEQEEKESINPPGIMEIKINVRIYI